MPMIELICKECNGRIQYDSERKLANCPYCGTEYVHETPVVNNTYVINKFVEDSIASEIEQLFQTYVYKYERGEDREFIYRKMLKDYPADYRTDICQVLHDSSFLKKNYNEEDCAKLIRRFDDVLGRVPATDMDSRELILKKKDILRKLAEQKKREKEVLEQRSKQEAREHIEQVEKEKRTKRIAKIIYFFAVSGIIILIWVFNGHKTDWIGAVISGIATLLGSILGNLNDRLFRMKDRIAKSFGGAYVLCLIVLVIGSCVTGDMTFGMFFAALIFSGLFAIVPALVSSVFFAIIES